MKITLEQRKLLTEWLGECWHKLHRSPKYDDISGLYCSKCKKIVNSNRTFENYFDFGAVVEKLIKTEQWEDFFNYAYLRLYRNTGILIEKGVGVLISDPERFCILVAEAKKAGVIK